MKNIVLLAFLTAGCVSVAPQRDASVSIQEINKNPAAFMNREVTITGLVTVQAGKHEIWAVGVSGAHTWGPERTQGCLGLQDANKIPIQIWKSRLTGTIKTDPTRKPWGIMCPNSLVLAVKKFETGPAVGR
jgi:hypothetical protein